MIAEFLASWPLFHSTYLAGWAIAVVLALVGVPVVARDQIFVGAAVAQASMLGLALGLWADVTPLLAACDWCHAEGVRAGLGGGFAVVAAIACARGGRSGARETPEAVTGWVFLTAGSLAVLVLAHSPHGLEEVHRLLSSTLLGASHVDVTLFAAAAASTAVLVTWRRPTLLLLVMDPDMAAAGGINVRAWTLATNVWLGAVVGLSVRVSGMIYAFACLVLPALVAKSLCREVGQMFVVAPLVSVLCAMVAFVLAHRWDLPARSARGSVREARPSQPADVARSPRQRGRATTATRQ